MKNIAIEPVTKKTRRKKRRSSRGENTEKWEELRGRGVVGIDSIPGVGIVSAQISGKSLPRLGRRIAGFFVRPPKTDRDGDGDNLRFNIATGKDDMPVIPVDLISGPTKNNFEDDTSFVGVENLKKAQSSQVKKFERWALEKTWRNFHREHFDWWTFPIDKGGTSTGFKYDVSGNPLEELKKDNSYLQSLSRAARLYASSLGWDSVTRSWMKKPDVSQGQGFSADKLNPARLFKIGRSLQIHGLKDDFDSHAAMVNLIRQKHAIGNDAFWDDPKNFVVKSRFTKPETGKSNISGRMAGMFDGLSEKEKKDKIQELIAGLAEENDMLPNYRRGKRVPIPIFPEDQLDKIDSAEIKKLPKIERVKKMLDFVREELANNRPVYTHPSLADVFSLPTTIVGAIVAGEIPTYSTRKKEVWKKWKNALSAYVLDNKNKTLLDLADEISEANNGRLVDQATELGLLRKNFFGPIIPFTKKRQKKIVRLRNGKEFTQKEYQILQQKLLKMWSEGFAPRDIDKKLDVPENWAKYRIIALSKQKKLPEPPSPELSIIQYAEDGFTATDIIERFFRRKNWSDWDTERIMKFVEKDGRFPNFKRGFRVVENALANNATVQRPSQLFREKNKNMNSRALAERNRSALDRTKKARKRMKIEEPIRYQEQLAKRRAAAAKTKTPEKLAALRKYQSEWREQTGRTKKTQRKISNISGSMRFGVSPTVYPMFSEDPRKTPKFIKAWKQRDDMSRKNTKGTYDLTFDWQDENSRLGYRDRVWSRRYEHGDARSFDVAPYGYHSNNAKEGLSDILIENLPLIANLGLHWRRAENKGYPRFTDQYGQVFTHSSTATRDADGEQIRNLKGHFEPNINPGAYWIRFESWIRNPFITMRDPKTRRDVGVRKYFDNNRALMLVEFDKRITNLYKVLNVAADKDFPENEFKPLAENRVLTQTEKPPDWVIAELRRGIGKGQKDMSEYSTLVGLHKSIKEQMEVVKGSARQFTVLWLETFLQKEYPQFFLQQVKMYPNYLKPSILDELSDERRKGFQQLMEMIHDNEIVSGRKPLNLDLARTRREMFSDTEFFTIQRFDEIIKQLHEDQLSRNKYGL